MSAQLGAGSHPRLNPATYLVGEPCSARVLLGLSVSGVQTRNAAALDGQGRHHRPAGSALVVARG